MSFEPPHQSRAIPADELPPLLRPRTSFWSKARKFLGPLVVVGVIVLKFGAKLKFLVLPLLKFFPVILKSGGSMIFMIWVYASSGVGNGASVLSSCCSCTNAATYSPQNISVSK